MENRPKLRDVNSQRLTADFGHISTGFSPVKVSLFSPETSIPCDIYFPGIEGPKELLAMKKLLYRGKPFTQDYHDYLAGEGIAFLYINSEDQEKFDSYVRTNMEQTLRSSDAPAETKTQALFGNAENIVRKVFRERPTAANIHQGRHLARSFADHVSKEKVAIDSLLSTFSKDYDTLTHSVQVGLLSMSFCAYLGWGADDTADLGLGALFHDIGKGVISDEILNKPSKLDHEEFDLIKRHTIMGYHQLRNTGLLSSAQLAVVLHHHEAMDGSGYFRLHGEKIHKYARVVRITDCFDALTTNRPYKEALSPFQALRVLENEMKPTFDLHLLKAFVNFLAMRENLGVQMGRQA